METYLAINTIKDCRNNYFHSFENRCVYGIQYTIMEDSEEVLLTLILECMKFKLQFYGLI